MSQPSLASDGSSHVMQFHVNDGRRKIQREPSGYRFPANEWPNPLKSLMRKALPNVALSKSLPQLPSMQSTGAKLRHGNDLKDSKRALHELVFKRSVQSEVIDFLVDCQTHYTKERDLAYPSDRHDQRQLLELMEEVIRIAPQFDNSNKASKLKRDEIIQEILRYPELYQSLTEMIIESRSAYETSDLISAESGVNETAENAVIAGHDDPEIVPLSETVDEDIMRYLHSR